MEQSQPTAASTIDAFPLPCVLIDMSERIVHANARAKTLLGSDITERHYITALRQPALLDCIEIALKNGQSGESRFLEREGDQDTTYRVSLGVIGEGKQRTVLATFEDLSVIENAGQMRRDFISNVSHELRTPLTALTGFIETLKGAARDDPAARDRFLDIMGAETSRMGQLVDDLLSLSKVEANERIRPSERIDIAGVIRSTARALEPLAEKADVTLALNLPDTLIEVPADADQLHQVLSNIIENAIKYGASGKRVDVTLSAPEPQPIIRGDGVEIVIQDYGPGFASHHIPRLTERFYRVDTHRSREIGGTGLGLAIVKHIINRHRGRLRVSSKEGTGARFSIILPANT